MVAQISYDIQYLTLTKLPIKKCRSQEKDVEEIKPMYIEGLRFIYVDTILDVFKAALTLQKVKNPKNIV